MPPDENTPNEPNNDPGTVLAGDPQNPEPGPNPAEGGDPEPGKTDEGSQGNADEGGTEGAPETYADFSMPEGMEVDAALLELATPVFKELNLTQEQAQKLVDLEAQKVQASQQAQVDSFIQLKQDWLTTAQNDKEIGGDKFDATVADAKLFLDKYGTPELKTLLNDYGVGNNVEFIRAFARAAQPLKEDLPGNPGNPSGGKTDRVSTLYPDAKGN